MTWILLYLIAFGVLWAIAKVSSDVIEGTQNTHGPHIDKQTSRIRWSSTHSPDHRR